MFVSNPCQPIAVTEGIKKEVEGIGEEFLKLEKYVNLNYTGFHKILKKHDRYIHTHTLEGTRHREDCLGVQGATQRAQDGFEAGQWRSMSSKPTQLTGHSWPALFSHTHTHTHTDSTLVLYCFSCPRRWLTNPCRAFYLQRLQAHNWTRGDYSDVMVNMSRIWSCLRGDTAAEATLNEKQV